MISVAVALGLPACGEDAEIETACCELLLVCGECSCGDGGLTIASSGDGKACRVYLDRKPLCVGSQFNYSKSQASADCAE